MYVPFQEYQLSPELAQYLSNQVGSGVNLDAPHDGRQESTWKFATMIYGILHGFWPWNEAPKDGGPHPDLLNPRVYTDPEHLLDRRHRILNAPLPIDENLPQDCKDVLQALFSKNPEDRPTLAELEGYPWFVQWARETQFFERPFSKDFQNSVQSKVGTDRGAMSDVWLANIATSPR
jgi:serine/threonine protein kinase